VIRNRLERFIAFGERIVHDAEREDEEALNWCGFLNLTVLSALAIVAVLIAWIWV
jgi:hypothetical protein